jgi:predicted metal-dependent hydrolase
MIRIDKLLRSSRRTIALIIQPDGTLLVRAPLRVPDDIINDFVEDHANWIHRKKLQIQSVPTLQKKEYREGELFLFVGIKYPLHIQEKNRVKLTLLEERFQISRFQLPSARDLFINWYKVEARKVISNRVKLQAQENGFSWHKLRISSARTRWGSCSSRGSLSFTWRLVMAPLDVIDYVVVHELVHTRIKNHSPAFWQRVAEIMPDYKKHVNWLKKNGRTLSLDGS